VGESGKPDTVATERELVVEGENLGAVHAARERRRFDE